MNARYLLGLLAIGASFVVGLTLSVGARAYAETDPATSGSASESLSAPAETSGPVPNTTGTLSLNTCSWVRKEWSGEIGQLALAACPSQTYPVGCSCNTSDNSQEMLPGYFDPEAVDGAAHSTQYQCGCKYQDEPASGKKHVAWALCCKL